MSEVAKYLLFLLCGGFLLTAHLSHELMPDRLPATPVVMPDGWISTPQPSFRGYFRHTLEVPFNPRHAWVRVAAEDYRLYVNGIEIARNDYLLVTVRTAYQGGLSDPAQRMNPAEPFPRGGRDSVAKAPWREWRMVHHYDLRPYLETGRNVLAVQAQSDRLVRFAIYGGIAGDGVAMDIPGHSAAWRASTEATVANDLPWFSLYADDLDWEFARSEQPPENLPIFAATDPKIWEEPFEAPAVTSRVAGDEQVFHLRLGDQGGGWLRVWSSWRFDLFQGREWIGRGGGTGDVETFDLPATWLDDARLLTLRMERRAESTPTAAEVPWLAVDGRIGTMPVSTAVSWQYLVGYHPDWLQGGGDWNNAPPLDLTSRPGPIRYHVPPGRTWTWLAHYVGAAIALSLLLAAVAWALVMPHQRGPRLARGCWLIAPALFAVLVVEGLRFRFGESDTFLTLLDPASAWLRLATAPVLLILTFVLVTRPVVLPAAGPVIGARPRLDARTSLFLLAPICLLALGLRIYGLEYQPPNADDYTSWDGARGILNSGVPLATSGIFYTRSPLFHYSLAAWLWLFGDSLVSARAFSLVPGIAVIPATYFLVVAVTRRHGPALATALVLAVDPWQLATGNFIRFYQLMQFFAVLSVYYCLKGFIWNEGKSFQTLFFICATAAALSQEIFITTFAAFMLLFLAFYRPFAWQRDANIWLGFAAAMLVIWLNLRVYSTISLTPNVALSSFSESLSVPHLVNPREESISVLTQLGTDFFWMNSGENAFWSMLFFAGLIYWIKYPTRAMLALYAVILVTLAALTVLVIAVNSRYLYGVYPIFVAIAIISAEAIVRRAAQWGASIGFAPAVARRWGSVVGGTLLLGWAFNAEFDKVWRSYSAYREVDYPSAYSYIKAHGRAGDRIASMRTPASAVMAGGSDYYAMALPAFDTVYMAPHGIIDRWSGGKLVWKLDQFREVFQQQARVWVIADDRRWPALRPGGASFLTECCRVEHEFFGGRVLLWERSAGRFPAAVDQGGGADSF